MATQPAKVFDESRSTRATALANMSGKQLFERYFVRDNGVKWFDDFVAEFDKIHVGTEDDYVYPFINSLVGQPLNYIATTVQKKVLPFVPKGYKINSLALIKDLEMILSENKNQVRQASLSGNVSTYVVELMDFVLINYNRGLDYKIGLTADSN